MVIAQILGRTNLYSPLDFVARFLMVVEAQNACCVVVFTVEEESLFALLPYLLTHHVLFDDTGCQKTLQLQCLWGEGVHVMTDRSRMERQSILISYLSSFDCFVDR